MRIIVAAAVALLLGVVIGGQLPKGEMAELRDRIAELEDQDCETNMGRDLAALLTAGAQASRRAAPVPDRELAEQIAQDNPEVAEAVEQERDERERRREQMTEGVQELAQDDEALNTARTALELRRAQARASLIEGADPDEQQLADIDQAVSDMNDTLFELADEVVTVLESGEQPTRRDAMAFAADALDTMIEADDRMQGALDPDQLEALQDEAVDPFSYIDPELVDMLGGLGAQ